MKMGAIIPLIIILICPAFQIAMPLNEFIDDYKNEEYITIKHKIIRNQLLNAMELNISLAKKKTEYEKKGHFYTIDVLGNENGTALTLLTNLTLSGGSIKIQYSNDNSTWVDHNNHKGFDRLGDGFDSIDLRDLNFTSLYLRYDFKRGKGKMTPRLYQTRIIWMGERGDIPIVGPPVDDYSVIFLAIGLIFMLAIAFLYAENK